LLERTLENPSKRLKMHVSKKVVLALVFLLAVTAGLWYGIHWWRVDRFIETTDDAYVGGNVTVISPHVSGYVAKIMVEDNQFVPAGTSSATPAAEPSRLHIATQFRPTSAA
jgi:multidrug resistance efflux pump